MNYEEIETMFETEESIEQLLVKCDTEFFSLINEQANSFIAQSLSTPENTIKALDTLTGLYMNLIDIYLVACTNKENEELAYFNNKRLEVEGRGDKFVSASTDKEASNHVANLRRVRNILEAYINKCEKAISTLQSKLRYWGVEQRAIGR